MSSADSAAFPMLTGGVRNGLFEELCLVAGRAPHRHLAIVDDAARLTYSELLQAAERLCEGFRDAQITPGERIAVILPNRSEFLVAAFAIWKHRAVFLPLNPQLREAEVASAMLDSGTRGLITKSRNEKLISSLRAIGVRILHAWLWSGDTRSWTYAGASEQSAAVPVDMTAAIDGHFPAITQYSTGSTGRPKRVTRSHAQLLGEVRSVATVMATTPTDRILGVAPFFHSYGLMVSALLTLLSGGTLYALDTFLPNNVGRLVMRERLSGLPAVPAMYQLLSACSEEHDLSSVRFCLSAGAPLSHLVAERFATRFGKRIRRLYGSTETGVISISADVFNADDVSTVGVPIPGVSVDVVNDAQCHLCAGQVGLVRVRSDFGATEYDNDHASVDSYFTARGFIPGDHAALSATGELTLHGRRPGLINTRGYKVDPTEVEQVLLELPGVREAVVLGVGADAADERIKAVLVAPSGGSAREVLEHCIRRLAPFKCPQIVEFRNELPRNTLGKVLRKYLLDEIPSAPPT